MRGKILRQILEFLEDGAANQINFFDAILSGGYGASMGKIEYEYQKNKKARDLQKIQLNDFKIKKKRLQKFLSKLKKDGLIIEIENSSNLVISNKGKQKLFKLKTTQTKYYKKENSETFTIISFDIPERLRRKRNWLREVIQNLGFKMVHKSVWIGKVKIPKQLIFDLEEMNILEFIEIFEISKTGGLEKIGEL